MPVIAPASRYYVVHGQLFSRTTILALVAVAREDVALVEPDPERSVDLVGHRDEEPNDQWAAHAVPLAANRQFLVMLHGDCAP
jgi:hypothetical protein